MKFGNSTRVGLDNFSIIKFAIALFLSNYLFFLFMFDYCANLEKIWHAQLELVGYSFKIITFGKK